MDGTAYYSHTRREIAPLLPPSATRIVDVGCGAGRTAAWVKSLYPGSTAVGLEGNPAMLPELQRNVDEAHIVNLDGQLPDIGAPDLILCLDVLEHLANADAVLGQLVSKLLPHGTVIVSIPNIAHISVSLPLLLKGQFEYQDAGILDRTHLRFFERRSAVALMNQAGLTVRNGLRLGLDGPRTSLLDRATFGSFRDHLTKQYVMAGTREPPAVAQGPVQWNIARPPPAP